MNKLPEASSTKAGIVTTSTQSLAGDKTVIGNLTLDPGQLNIKGGTDSYVSLWETTVERWRLQSTGSTNGFDFIYQAGGITPGKISAAGVWTIGESTATANHIIQNNGNTQLIINGLNGTSSQLGFSKSGTAKWVIGSDNSSYGTDGFFFFASGGSNKGGITNAGVWEIGATGFTGNHVLNGTWNVIVNNTAPFTWSLTSSSASGILGTRAAISGRDRQYIVLNNTASSTAYWFGNDGNFRGGSTSGISNDGSADGGTIIGTQTSDERLKANIQSLEYGLSEVLQLQPIRFEMNGESAVGFGAQTTQPIIPEAVYDTLESIESDPEGSTKLAMDYSRIIPVLVNAIKELKAQVDDLQAQVDGY